MEIVQLGGCTVQEKLAIAREHLAARQIARNGLDPAEVQVTDDAFLAIIEGYTREAGVRGLEHQIGKLLRKVATRVDSGQLAAPTMIGAGDVKQYLGRSVLVSRTSSCPVATSQIWTTYRSPSALRSTSIRSAQLPKCCRWRYRWMWRRVRDCSKQPEI